MTTIEEIEKAKADGHKWYSIYSNDKNYPTKKDVQELNKKGYKTWYNDGSEDHDYTVFMVEFYPEKPLPIRTKRVTVTLTVKYEGKCFSEKQFAQTLLNRLDNFGTDRCSVQEYTTDKIYKQSYSYKNFVDSLIHD